MAAKWPLRQMPALRLRTWLLVLVVVALVPFAASLGYALKVQADQQESARTVLLRERAGAAAARAGARMALVATLTRGVALAAEETGDPPEMADVDRFLPNRRLVSGIRVERADGGGPIVTGHAVACTSAPVAQDGPPWRLARAQAGGAWSAEYWQPLRRGPLAGCSVVATVPLETFQRAVQHQGLTADWVVAILDADLRIVARSASEDKYVGTGSTRPLVESVRAGGDRAFRGVARDGQPVAAYVVPVPGTDWHAAVGITIRSIDRETRHHTGPFIAASVLAFLFAVAAAVVLARSLARDVGSLADVQAPQAPGLAIVAEVGAASARLREAQERVQAFAAGQAALVRQLQQENGRRLDTENSLKAVQRRLLGAQEAERERMARELHDELGQELSLLHLLLASARDATGARRREMLAECDEAVDRLVRRVRHLAHELRPPQLDDLGLAPALRSLARRTREMSGLEVRVQATDEPLRLAREAETALFRVAQGALTNAIRHAGASSIQLELDVRADGVRLRVRDDGRGFDPAQVLAGAPPFGQPHLGLVIMRERVQSLGGWMRLEAAPGEGSTVEVWVPRGAVES